MNIYFQPNSRSTDAVQSEEAVAGVPIFATATHMPANDNDPGPEVPPPMPPAAALSVRRNHRALPVAA